MVQNKYGVVSKNNLHNLLTSFYTDDEIFKAKKCLHNIAIKLIEAKTFGRFVPRFSNIKQKMNTADLLNVHIMLDRQKAILPLFVAGSMMRISCIRPLESDVVA